MLSGYNLHTPAGYCPDKLSDDILSISETLRPLFGDFVFFISHQHLFLLPPLFTIVVILGIVWLYLILNTFINIHI